MAAASDRQLLSFDPAGVFDPRFGLQPGDLAAIGPLLERARQEVLVEDARHYRDNTPPPEKQPLDHGFFELPERLLADYRQDRAASELGRIFTTAERLKKLVDRVVVLGIGGSYMGAKALLEACCQPYYNELSRADRGGNPRMYFEGNNLDNDATRGLLHLLGRGGSDSVDDRWAIVVISKSGGTLETAVAFRQFAAALKESAGGNALSMARRIVPVTGDSGALADLAQALGCSPDDTFPVPDGVGGRFSVLSAVGLVPAALMGLDVVRLLEGAAAMNDHFRKAAPAENVVLQYVGAAHLLETRRGAIIRVLSVWAKGLEYAGLWYDQLLAESLGKRELGATPLTTVNTRDLHSRAQQHQEGRRDKLITNVIVDRWRFDPLPVGSSERNEDRLNDLAEQTLPELMTAAIAGTNEAYRADGRPTADLHLPACDEWSLGQFFQMMMLATVVEGRLLGINPYGQPGVQKYKEKMTRILRDKK